MWGGRPRPRPAPGRCPAGQQADGAPPAVRGAPPTKPMPERLPESSRYPSLTGPVLTPLVSLVGRIRRQDEQDPPGRFVPHNYSYRSATMGSIFVARLAGI